MKIFLTLILLLSSLLYANDDSVKIKARKASQYVIVDGINKNPFSITVMYKASYKNLKSEKKLPLLFVLKPFSKTEVLRLKILKSNFTYKAHYDWTIGSKDAKHDSSHIYSLPFKKGTSQQISQGFNGKFTHYGKSQYAVDFGMKEGTGVYAARAGIVVRVKSDSNKGGASRSFEKYANEIIIEHNDGTLASYTHLKKNGALVKVSQKISQGELIGYSGKTGYARGPHLHFIVYKATDGKSRISFPIKFKGAKGIITNPKKGNVYKSI